MDVGRPERITQQRVVRLFHEQLEYDYLGKGHHCKPEGNIQVDLLQKFLTRQGYSEALSQKAINTLTRAATNQVESLYDLNKEVYSLLRYGVKEKVDNGDHTETIWLINWKEPSDNDFAIAEEVTIRGKNDKRPDILLYVNGIAIGVLELKRSTVAVSAGIRQNLDSQKDTFIQRFFATVQLVMAGNDTQGIRYGTIDTKEKHYLTWKEESDVENLLDRHILKLCQKERLIEILHDFIAFDRGIKKICRHNQYFGVIEAQKSIRQREGGIMWHMQGTGKSLTMVWLAKWIRENVQDARVLIITDRDELDKQIEKVFSGVNEAMYRTKSGKDLLQTLNTTREWLVCSLIHKFGKKSEPDYDQYIEDLENHLPQDFKAKGDIYVFVDECHRTQSGKLHAAMKKILPHAVMIGFTGTPLLKKDKQKSIEVFGKYIHTYKFNEAVKDKVVLDLKYEARKIEQDLTSPAKIDQWFAAKTKGLTPSATAQLKKRWGTMQSLLSSKSRLEKIVADILLDMATKDRLQNGKGNALLVTGSIAEACKYYELFQQNGFTKCAIITSYKPSVNDLKGESTGEDAPTDNIKKYETYQKMLNGKTPEAFEDTTKNKFIEEPAQMKLLIVVDKLLTGFDAPSATYLYIDKKMRDHGLFQAITRVNRLDDEGKQYGYIIDYEDLFQSVEKSVKDYTSGAFGDYDAQDVAGLVSDHLQKGKEHLEQTVESIRFLCEPVEPPQDEAAYIRYFCAKHTEQKRFAFYKHVAALIRAYANMANQMEEAGYPSAETEAIKREVQHYENVRKVVKIVSVDYIDLKSYESDMRHLIDTYICAEDSEVISAFDDKTLVELIVERGADALTTLPPSIQRNREAVAETIENNVRRLIIDETPTNPKYYEKMSTVLDELIKQRKAEVKSYEEYLASLVELCNQIKKPATYPERIRTAGKRALYDNLNQDEQLVLALDQTITSTAKEGWRGHKIKEREVTNAIKKHISDADLAKRILEIVKQHEEEY